MSWLVQELENLFVYIDDLLIINSGSYDDHLKKLNIVLQRLSKGDLKVKQNKGKWATSEVEYLGHWITGEGVKPMTDKVDSILAIQHPHIRKEIGRFMDMINFYRDMWKHRSHLLAPLAALTSKKRRWKWDEECEKSFEGIKAVIAKDVMLSYPKCSEDFIIHTDASATQLGGAITQNNKPLAFLAVN